MKTILIIIGGYLPGYKFGGPIQSIKNVTDRLGEEYHFQILTVDRDYGDSRPYPDICYDDWNAVGNAEVWYAKPKEFKGKLIKKLAENAGLVYVCGCFDNYAIRTMWLKWLGQIKAPVVIAPMGVFSPGAFHTKYLKKKAFVVCCKMFGWFKKVGWSVTGEQEKQAVEQIIGKNAICFKAQDIPKTMKKKPESREKEKGKLRIIFLSRISPEKNLDYAIEILKGVKGDICFDIYGMPEDEAYYAGCMKKAEELPDDVICSYKGEVKPEKVVDTFSKYHVFLFPTKGENFGHVIYEAMAGGCIPIISDRNPWQELEEKQVGRVIPLEQKEVFEKALQFLVDMDQREYTLWQRRTADYAWEYSQHIDCQGYREIFDR